MENLEKKAFTKKRKIAETNFGREKIALFVKEPQRIKLEIENSRGSQKANLVNVISPCNFLVPGNSSVSSLISSLLHYSLLS